MSSTEEKKIFTVENVSRERLDHYLMSVLPDYSRSYLQQCIKEEHVLVDGVIVTKPRFLVGAGNQLAITFRASDDHRDIKPEKVDFQVIDVQEDFIVINKPAGLMVHGSATADMGPTLVNGLLYMFEELREFDDKERPGIVHRLDRETSGLLIVARTQKGKSALGTMFHDRKMKKEYLAVVKGHPPKAGKIDYDIGRHPKMRHKMAHATVQPVICPREAHTIYRVEEFFDDETLLSVQIMTGRTHQIRVHCAAIGHSVLGDTVYGLASKLIKRQALHARRLSFEYGGKHFEYVAPLPKDFLYMVKCLRKNAL
jgi:23S rRNA pseudouridine1911/1915/1917 synthase